LSVYVNMSAKHAFQTMDGWLDGKHLLNKIEKLKLNFVVVVRKQNELCNTILLGKVSGFN